MKVFSFYHIMPSTSVISSYLVYWL